MRITSPLRVLADIPRLLWHPRTSRERIVAFQERRLRQLVRHAYDNVIVEVMKSDKASAAVEPGESGSLIGTSLHFAAMPMIRYQLGDIVIRGPSRCACGAPFTTLTAIQGRSNDFFSLADGRVLHPYLIGSAVWKPALEWMHQYQVIQERRDRVSMRIVPLRQPEPADVAELRRVIEELLGPLVELTWSSSTTFPRSPTGSFGYTGRWLSRSTGDSRNRKATARFEASGNPGNPGVRNCRVTYLGAR